jgi:hypothetical protein
MTRLLIITLIRHSFRGRRKPRHATDRGELHKIDEPENLQQQQATIKLVIGTQTAAKD